MIYPIESSLLTLSAERAPFAHGKLSSNTTANQSFSTEEKAIYFQYSSTSVTQGWNSSSHSHLSF